MVLLQLYHYNYYVKVKKNAMEDTKSNRPIETFLLLTNIYRVKGSFKELQNLLKILLKAKFIAQKLASMSYLSQLLWCKETS